MKLIRLITESLCIAALLPVLVVLVLAVAVSTSLMERDFRRRS